VRTLRTRQAFNLHRAPLRLPLIDSRAIGDSPYFSGRSGHIAQSMRDMPLVLTELETKFDSQAKVWNRF